MNFFRRIKLVAFATACMLVSLVGCNVQEAVPSVLAEEGINLELVEEVEAIAEPAVQKIVFVQMLTNEERVYVFKKRVIEKIQTLSLTVEQTDHLNQLLAFMSPEIYNTSSPQARKGKDFLNDWTERGQVIFNKAVLTDIVSSLTPSAGKSKSTTKTAPPKSSPNCACNSYSDYCPEGYACTLLGSCASNGMGCGTMWTQPCNGVCDISHNYN